MLLFPLHYWDIYEWKNILVVKQNYKNFAIFQRHLVLILATLE